MSRVATVSRSNDCRHQAASALAPPPTINGRAQRNWNENVVDCNENGAGQR